MNLRFHSCIRSALVALGMLAGLSAPAAAMPFAGVSRPVLAPAADGQDVVQVRYRRCYDRWCGRYGRSHLGYRYWDDDWRYRRYYNSYPDSILALASQPTVIMRSRADTIAAEATRRTCLG